MIHQPSVDAVNASRFNEHFGKPIYDTFGFAQIPQTIRYLLTGTGEMGLPAEIFSLIPHHYERVILVLIDGFGWRFFEQYRNKYPFLKRFVDEGIVTKLTTQFPSTTSAHMTTLHTGLPPSKSGIYEWFYYEPLHDRVIAPLLYSYAGDKARNTLEQSEVPPRAIYPKDTVYQTLKRKGIKSKVFQDLNYTPSPYSKVMFTGSSIVPYKTYAEALLNLTDAVVANKGKQGYFFMYMDTLDALAHKYGPSSRQFEAEVDAVMNLLEKGLNGGLTGKTRKTLLLVTADHGQIEISPKTTIFLNQLDPSIPSFFKTNQKGDPILFGGSPRDLFLYIQDERLDEAQGHLAKLLEGRAAVYRTQELIDQGFFGPLPASEKFMGRVGNLVLLPYENESIFWREIGRFDQGFYGHHGGLSRQEMETQLLALPY